MATTDLILLTNVTNPTILHIWNSLYDEMVKYTTIHEVTNAIANKYRFDLHGMLKYHFNIPEKHIYPNMIVNDCSDSTRYTGDIFNIKIIDPEYLTNKDMEVTNYIAS